MFNHRSHAGVISLLLILICVVVLFPTSVYGQMPGQATGNRYVSRFDAFNGFSYMATPGMNLYERGFNTEFGVNLNKWLAMGFDYSVLTGNSSLGPSMLSSSVAGQLAPLMPLLPPGYKLIVPYSATTRTYSAGPQINFRQWKPVTFFTRPALGLLHQDIVLKPTDAIQTAVVNKLVPGAKKDDTTLFYGVGGGFDFNVTDHFAIRLGLDYVHYFVFDGTLNSPSNTIRISIGPTARFGKNVLKNR